MSGTFQQEFLAAIDKQVADGTLSRRDAARYRRAANSPRKLARIESEAVRTIHDENPNALKLDAAKNIDWAATLTKLKSFMAFLNRISAIASLFGG